MLKKINGLLVFCYSYPEIKKRQGFLNKDILIMSLLVMLMGIFLLPKPAYLSDITSEKLIELTNLQRQKSGLNYLTANQLLTKAAMDKADAIIKAQLFKHTIDDKKFSGWIKDAGYNYSFAGENLALDFVTSEGIINAWNNSPAHKANLLNPYYQEIGIAVKEGLYEDQNTILVVQIFGAPANLMVQPPVSDLTLNSQSLATTNTVKQKYKLNRLVDGNYLTHSAIQAEIIPLQENKFDLSGNNQMNTAVNNIFDRLNLSLPLLNYLTLYYYIMLSTLFLFFYSSYFVKITKLFNLKS